jgi:HSP90 family molecular chaperone
MGRMEPGVSLYSRKVLIESKSKDIVPDWMRFVKGVVDSEDLPLSVSREKAQDSRLIAKLRKVLTRKFISHLSNMAKKDPEKYKTEFYKEYNFFLKEGICQDFDFQEPLAKLLYFETSKGMRGDISSLDEYISRCTPEQNDIYYLHAPTRDTALQSPYLEAFERSGREVIFVYSAIDDFVMANLEKYEGRMLVSADKTDIDLPKDDEETGDTTSALSETEASDFCAWFQVTLNDKVSKCKTTARLESSPAVVTDNESGAMRRMMRMVDTTDGGRDGISLPKQQVEINPKHPVIVGLNSIRESEPTLAKILAEQIFDNCLLAAGLLDDGRSMLPRLNDILYTVVKEAQSTVAKPSSDEEKKEE